MTITDERYEVLARELCVAEFCLGGDKSEPDPMAQMVQALLRMLDRQRAHSALHFAQAKESAASTDILREAIDRSGLDTSLCLFCSAIVVCIPDGLPACDSCAGKESKR